MDVSGDGFVDLSELEAAQQEALKALGEPASPWKQYVDPAQSVMCYHNILTDEKVSTTHHATQQHTHAHGRR